LNGWKRSGQYEDIWYDTTEGVAKITINRPEVRNAFRPTTLFELSHAFNVARDDPEIGVIILTGAGKEAFCSGGDQRIRGDDGYRDASGVGRLNVLDLQVQSAQSPLARAAVIVLDEAAVDTRACEFGGLPRLHEKTAGIGEYLRFDQNHVGNRRCVKFHG